MCTNGSTGYLFKHKYVSYKGGHTVRRVAQACCGVCVSEICKTQLHTNLPNLLVAAPAFCRALYLDGLCRALLTLVILNFVGFFFSHCVKKFFKQKWYFAL